MKKTFIFVGILSLVIFSLIALQQPETNISASSHEVDYEDGTYRGVFIDREEIQVNVQFSLENNVITDINFRRLFYSGTDYLSSEEDIIIGLNEQHQELLDYLKGKHISALNDLYEPGEIVQNEVTDTNTGATSDEDYSDEEYTDGDSSATPNDDEADTYTGATLRSGKIISAVRDALNRGVYRY